VSGWLRSAGWAVTCAALAVFLQSFFRQPVALALACGVGAFTVLAAVRPFAGLLVLAGLGPLSTGIFNFARGSAGSVQFGETVVLAFLTGWAASMARRGEPLKAAPAVRVAVWLLSAAAVASAIVGWAGIRAEQQMQPTGELLRYYVLRDYPLRSPGGEPLTAAVVFASGLLLLLAGSQICGGDAEKRFSTLRMMAVGAMAAASCNLLRITLAALDKEDVLGALRTYASFRINVHYADLNAAGSYFALTLMIAAGMHGRHRWLAAAATPLIAAALWLTGSRFALAAVFVVVTILAVWAWRRATSAVGRVAFATTGALIVGGAALLALTYPAGRNEGATSAFTFRLDLARAGVQMAADQPLTGVGLLAFIVLLLAACRELIRSEIPRPPHLIGLLAGIMAFLLTCLGGHPLVVPEVSYTFYLALGLGAAPTAARPPRPLAARWRLTALAIIAALAVSLPWRAASAVRDADMGMVTIGLSSWQRDDNGVRYRWAGARAVFHRPASDSAISIPLRYGSETVGPIDVRIFIDGQEADRVRLLPEEGWRVVRLVFHRRPVARYRKVELVAIPSQSTSEGTTEPRSDGGLLRIGRASDE
jgi:hypothetical protein